MAELIVRKAERGDAEAVAKLEQICFAAPWSEEALIRDMTENEMAAYVVAEYEEQIVGYVGLWIIIDEGHINNVAVSPQYRRQHIASRLIDKMLRWTGRKPGSQSPLREIRISGSRRQKGIL